MVRVKHRGTKCVSGALKIKCTEVKVHQLITPIIYISSHH